MQGFQQNKLWLDPISHSQLDTFYWLVEPEMGLWNKYLEFCFQFILQTRNALGKIPFVRNAKIFYHHPNTKCIR